MKGLYRCVTCGNERWIELPKPADSMTVLDPWCYGHGPMAFTWQVIENARSTNENNR